MLIVMQCYTIWFFGSVDKSPMKIAQLLGIQLLLPAVLSARDNYVDYLCQKNCQISHNMTLRPQKVTYLPSQHFFILVRHCRTVLFDPGKEEGAGLLSCKNCHNHRIPHLCQLDKLNSVLHTILCNIELPRFIEGFDSMVCNQTVCKGNIS